METQRLGADFFRNINQVHSDLRKKDKISHREIHTFLDIIKKLEKNQHASKETLLRRLHKASGKISHLDKKIGKKASPIINAEITRIESIRSAASAASAAPAAPAAPGVFAVPHAPSHHFKNVSLFSTQDMNSFIFCDHKNNKGTLTLKTSDHSYVKLRNVSIRPASEIEKHKDEYLIIGSQPALAISKRDIEREMSTHKDEKVYGPYHLIKNALKDFETKAQSELLLIHRQDRGGKKLTTEMDEHGHIRAVHKEVTGEGSLKLVQKITVLGESSLVKVRAKIKPGVDRTSARLLGDMRKEIQNFNMLQAAHVPNIVHITQCPAQDRRKVRIDMPFMKGGNLGEMIEKEAVSPDVRQKRLIYAHQLARALGQMHRTGHCCNDFKVHNCLFDPDTDQAVVGDLGTVSKIGERAIGGTYPSPEKAGKGIEPSPADPANDLWAFGLSLYSMFYGAPAVREVSLMHNSSPRSTIIEGRDRIVGRLSPADPLQNLIIDLLSTEPHRRPHMDEVEARLQSLI